LTNYGFVIDNRTCIGCHACTVACKSEHDVAIGVNRTFVKYIEKGEFPNSTREFSVHRCNHCEDSPCTTICPTTALFTREDGIVDFDNERCIGCKSCMQACPYDALYIDPNNGTAAKCNYCVHRIENSYEPACVVVCPTQSIISGDLDDPHSNISKLVSENETTVRKPEAGTKPNLFYIKGSEVMLDPSATERTGSGMWSEQAAGVGHYAKYAHKKSGAADTHSMIVQLALQRKSEESNPRDRAVINDVMDKLAERNAGMAPHANQSSSAKRVYDQPSKGILWGWEVSAYIWTKGIASGTYLIAALMMLMGMEVTQTQWWAVIIIGFVFLGITGVLLILDLDRPTRFLYVMLRPNWSSWLVKGAYILAGFSGILAASAGVLILGLDTNYLTYLAYIGVPLSLLTGVYTAWLFQQAKGRSWSNDKMLPAKFLLETIAIGSAVAIPLLMPSVLNAIIGAFVLSVAFFHGKHVVLYPQMETLA